MGRPPCCDKAGVKKGPWTPEEDIMLVSYVQEHGSGNWRAVPTCTGLRRCSKSCRLRWTNYLRPGIKRGSFTGHEEKMIIQLQALLGNKWAAIASYLPERTDNDIKNYWNTHLKKKLKRLQNGSHHETLSGNDLWSSAATPNNHHPHSTSRGRWERRLQADIHTAKQALEDAISLDGAKMNSPKPSAGQAFSYASSTENIARLLKDWVKQSPEHVSSKCSTPQNSGQTGIDLSEAFESLFGFEKFEPSNSDGLSRLGSPSLVRDDGKHDPDGLVPLSAIDDWLVDEQGKDYLINFTFDEHSDSF